MNDQAVQDVAMIARKAIDRIIFLEKKMSKKPFESMVAALTTKPEIVKNPIGRKPKNPRRWQGLTADEIWKCNAAPSGSAVEYHICMAHQNVLDFAEAIEAKLRKKNA